MHAEATYYIAPDGTAYRLDDTGADRWLNEIEGLGMAPLRHTTRRGYGQDGETHVATRLEPRVVNVQVTERYANRQAMFAGHLAWLRALAPGEDAGTLRKVLPNGRAFDLDVRLQSGMDASGSDRLGTRTQTYLMQLVAHDPVWRAAEETVFEVAGADPEQLVLPFAFPFRFDGDTLRIFEIDYTASWRAWPALTLYGPMLSPVAIHDERGATIRLLDDIPSGGYVTVSPDPEYPTAVNPAGMSLIGQLSEETDLAGFYLQPGANTIRVYAYGTGAGSKVRVAFYEQYLGV